MFLNKRQYSSNYQMKIFYFLIEFLMKIFWSAKVQSCSKNKCRVGWTEINKEKCIRRDFYLGNSKRNFRKVQDKCIKYEEGKYVSVDQKVCNFRYLLTQIFLNNFQSKWLNIHDWIQEKKKKQGKRSCWKINISTYPFPLLGKMTYVIQTMILSIISILCKVCLLMSIF